MPVWRDQDQAARACDALCSRLRAGRLWQDGGPTARAEQLLEMRRLPAIEKTLIRIAWSLWNGRGEVGLSELLELDESNLRSVGLLLAAMATSPAAIDGWVELTRAEVEREDELRRRIG